MVTSLLQLGVNQLRVTRLRVLARNTSNPTTLPVDFPSQTQSAQPPTPTPSNTFSPSLRDSLENPAKKPSTQAEESRSLPARIMAGVTAVLPVRKLSDEEYLAALEKKRAEVDKRLEEIEDEERRIFESESRRR